MTASEIKRTKANLITWIEQLSDDTMLSMLDGLRISKSNNDWWDDLSEYEKRQINEGLDDAENGRYVSSGEFWSRQIND